MQVTDIPSLIAFIASPLLIAFISTQAEKWEWFQAISPNGKLAAIGAVSVLLAWLSLGLSQFIAGNPDVAASIDPFVRTALMALNFVASQATHGVQKAKGLN